MVAPAAGVKVPEPALKVPPVPEVRVHTPPVDSPVIRENRLTGVVELSHTAAEPLLPAFGGVAIVAVILTPVLLQVASLSLTHATK